MKKLVALVLCCLLFLCGCMHTQSVVGNHTNTFSCSGSDTITHSYESCDEKFSDATVVNFPESLEATVQTIPGFWFCYSGILEDYNHLVNFRLSDSFEKDWNNGNRIPVSDTLAAALYDDDGTRSTFGTSLKAKWSDMLVNMISGIENPTKRSFGYILKDIDNDNYPELFWVREDKTVLALFTIHDSIPVLLDAYNPKYKCVVSETWNIYTVAYGGAGYITYDVRELTGNGNLRSKKQFGTDGISRDGGEKYFEVLGGNKIYVEENRFDELKREYPYSFGWEFLNTQVVFLT